MEIQEQTTYMPESDHFYQDQEESIIITPNKKKVYLQETNSSIPNIKIKMRKQTIHKAIIPIFTILISAFLWMYFSSITIRVEKLSLVQQPTVDDSLLNNKVCQEKQNNQEGIKKQIEQTTSKKRVIDILKEKQKQFKKKEKKRLQKNLQEKALQKFHPWNLNNKDKEALLDKYKNMPAKNLNQSEFMPIFQNREEEILPILQEFQKTSQLVDYSKIKMNDQQRQLYQQQYNQKLELHKQITEKRLKQQKEFRPNRDDFFSQPHYKIKRKQWYSAFQYHTLVGTNEATDSQLKQRAQKQIQIFQKKYKIGSYKNQLKMCIISPGVNNEPYERYLWHIESVLQQNYSNYRLIIIDDTSIDKTVQLISKHLKWRNVSQEKVTLIRNKQSQKTLANIFYVTHKFCDFGEVQMVLDSDDQFIGRQVLKVLNAVYQKYNYLTVYSTLIMAQGNPFNPLHVLGISRDHLKQDLQENNFRLSNHRGYSSLRTMLSDLFLLTKPESLKDKDGKFYWIVGDNAYYYPALEKSCGKTHYLPQIFYYYNMNTGINNDVNRANNKEDYQRIVTDIDFQKNYRCLATEFTEIDNYGK